MNTTIDRINKDTYERYVARLRVHIQLDGLHNTLNGFLDALESERDETISDNADNVEKALMINKYNNLDTAMRILELVNHTLDINYSNQNKNLLTEGIDKLINDLSDLK